MQGKGQLRVRPSSQDDNQFEEADEKISSNYKQDPLSEQELLLWLCYSLFTMRPLRPRSCNYKQMEQEETGIRH